MATETEVHIGQANSVNIVEYVGNIKVEDSGGLNAAKAKEATIDDIRNKETLQVMSSGQSITNVVEIPENTKLESDFAATLVPDIEADVKEDKDQVDKGNVIELSNGFADSTLAKGQEQKSEATKESIFPEAAVEEVRCTEEPSPVEVSENILEFVSNEAATSDATAQEVKTTNKNNIEESIPLVSFQGFPEPAAEEELCLLDAAVAEKENTDTLIVDSSQAEEITENVPETSMTETDEDAQVIDSTTMEEGQKNLTQSCVSATENKATLIAGSSRTLVVIENVLETAVLETPIEVPKAPKESSVSIVMNADTTVEAFEFISKVPDDAKKVEEKKENSTEKLFMHESEGVAEEQKMTTDENISYYMDQVNKGDPVKLSNGFADNTLLVEHELKSEATGESIFPEAAVEEVKCTEDPSPVEVSEDILGFVSDEAATSDATALEVKTTNTNSIEESTTLESFQGVPESAAVEELCLLDAAVIEKENADALLVDSSQAEEVTENVPKPSLTETGEDTQVTDSTAKEEIQENNPEAFVPTTEKKENQIAESSITLVVTGNVLETAILETPLEVPRAHEESSVSVVTNEDTTIEASEVISKVSGNAKMVEEKKENSLGKLFMQENEGAAEEQNMTTDGDTSMVESPRDNVLDTGNEKTRIEAKKTEEDGELSNAEVRSSNKKSNNIFTKMKQSIVKAKKAIIGKSPSSKAMEVECRDNMKL